MDGPHDAEVRARALVAGRVQGVFFRQSAAERARSLGLTGWVRNLPDGRVEAVFQGSRQAVESMLDWCGRGPSGAHVDHVETTWEPPDPSEDRFAITG